MKRLWPCLAVVIVLASCTSVEDFGTYWDKGIVDPALEGSWKKLGRPGQDSKDVPGPDMLRFKRNGSSYAVQAINPIDQSAAPADIERQKADNDAGWSARTLPIGRHMFLMNRDANGSGEGIIERYEVQSGTLREYSMDNGAGVEFMAAKHPTAKNIKRNEGPGEYLVIDKFDDEVFQILSEIADNPAYWILNCEYRSVPSDWVSELAAVPGSTLPREDAPQSQRITLFEVSQQRDVGAQFFVAGVGYVAFNGGGTILAGPNRGLDPYVELTVANGQDPVLAACRDLLTPASFVDNAVQISGSGHFAALPGVGTRQLAVLRLETLSGCKLVPRR